MSSDAGPSSDHTPLWYRSHLLTHARALRLAECPTNRPADAELAPFFRALSRHSRYQPDLIARDTGFSEPKVLRLLADLETGAERLRRSDGRANGQRNREARWGVGHAHLWRPGCAPGAREVSDEWIEEEESLAEMSRCDVTAKNGKGVDAEQWLEHLDDVKLKELDHVLMPSWSRWYEKRLIAPPTVPLDEATGKKGKAKQKTVADDEELGRLLAISLENRDEDITKRIDVLKNKKRNRENYYRKRAKRSETVEHCSINEESVRDLRRLGVDRWMMERGLDLFNYGQLAGFTRLGCSVTLLEALRDLLLDHLHVLLFRVIALAETHNVEVGPEHIHLALALDGHDVYKRPRPERGGASIVGWTNMQWTCWEEGGAEDEALDEWTNSEGGETDEEDARLDELLDNLDEKLDAMTEAGLWKAQRDGTDLVEWDDAWASKGYRSGLEPAAQAAREEYEVARLGIAGDRRRRRANLQRSKRFPTTGAKQEGAAKRAKSHKSAAWIDESDMEESEHGMQD